MRTRVVLSLVLIAVSVATASSAELQFGIRFDSTRSIQWSGRTVYARGDGAYRLETNSAIVELWPGPVAGTLAANTSDGLALLLGTKWLPVARPEPTFTIARSSRSDTLWLATRNGARTRITEIRSDGASRPVVDILDAIVDFDVDEAGAVTYATRNGRIFIARPGSRLIELKRPRECGESRRVFTDRATSEISIVSAEGRLCRYELFQSRWTVTEFDPRKIAVVRHLGTRRIALEERFQR